MIEDMGCSYSDSLHCTAGRAFLLAGFLVLMGHLIYYAIVKILKKKKRKSK